MNASSEYIITEKDICTIIDWLSYRRYDDTEVDSLLDRVRSHPKNLIKTTSELPKIIPPLPEGDTTDLNVWQKYWVQHDDQIKKDILTQAITRVQEKTKLPISTGQRLGFEESIDVLRSLLPTRSEEQSGRRPL